MEDGSWPWLNVGRESDPLVRNRYRMIPWPITRIGMNSLVAFLTASKPMRARRVMMMASPMATGMNGMVYGVTFSAMEMMTKVPPMVWTLNQ